MATRHCLLLVGGYHWLLLCGDKALSVIASLQSLVFHCAATRHCLLLLGDKKLYFAARSKVMMSIVYCYMTIITCCLVPVV